jgi:pimeloyl-ACP methyl ester carboxylesterase
MQQITNDQSQTVPAPLGKLVDIGGRRLHLIIVGAGTPPVIFEAGSGGFALDWSLVLPQVAAFTQVCAYDRAGHAWSEPGPTPRTAKQIAFELRMALRHGGVPGPYVLVGHSFGGFLVRAFAAEYAADVAGMVLVDVVHEDARVPMRDGPTRIRETASGRVASAPQLEVSAERPPPNFPPELHDYTPPLELTPPFDRLSPELQALRLWADAQPAHLAAWFAEMDWSPEDVARLYTTRDIDTCPLADRPLVVVSREQGGYRDAATVSATELEAERIRQQRDLLRLSRNSRQIIAAGSGHLVQLEMPDLVVRAIRDVVRVARGGEWLAADDSQAG